MNLKIFATVHSLMKDTRLIDRCQVHLPVQYALNIEFIRQLWLTGSHTWVAGSKQALIFRVHTGCLHSNKTVNTI